MEIFKINTQGISDKAIEVSQILQKE